MKVDIENVRAEAIVRLGSRGLLSGSTITLWLMIRLIVPYTLNALNPKHCSLIILDLFGRSKDP